MSYFPSPESYVADIYPRGNANYTIGTYQQSRMDTNGALVTRGAVLTDEGSFYDPFAGVALGSSWTSHPGTGGTISVANSTCSIASGTTAADEIYIYRATKFVPLTFIFVLSVSQRIANQDIYFGFGDNATAPSSDTMFARFHLTGTNNTQICCETQSSADTGGNEGLNTQILIPIGATTASKLIYRIDVDNVKTRFWIGLSLDSMILLATRSINVPNLSTTMYQRVRILNGTTPATPTTISIDTISTANYNVLETRVREGGLIGVTQNVTASVVNSSITNLTSGGNSRTFTGTGESTLNVSGIQVSLFADQNCLIKVQQSSNGTDWDISDQFNYTASANFGNTVQAISSYFRVVVTSLVDTTVFRLQSCLCPIVEALPRSLDANGNLKIASQVDSYGFVSSNTPIGESRSITPVRLIGADFEGYFIDPNFWTAATAGGSGAAVTQAGGSVTLTSGTAASTTTLYSVRRAKYTSGASNRYRGVVQIDAGTANNTRRWGAAFINNYNFTISVGTPTIGNTYSNNSQYFTVTYISGATIHCYGTGAPTASGTLTFVSGPGSGNLTYTANAVEAYPTDGAWFQMSGTTFSIVTMIAGVPSTVSSGSFNGSLGYTFAPGTNVNTYEIYWTNSSVWFVVGGALLHKVSASTADWSNFTSLNVFSDTINSGAATSVNMYIRVASIYRLGSLVGLSIYKHIATAGTYVCKYSGGLLKNIAVNTIVGGTVTIYDNWAAVGNVLGVITVPGGGGAGSFVGNTVVYDIPFYYGLTIVTSANTDITISYE
jgi:hypothetical protein